MKGVLTELKVVFFIALLAIGFVSKAQLYEAGIHFGYDISSLSVKENELSNGLFVRDGLSISGFNFGIQLRKSPPKNQNLTFFHVIPSFLLEADLCRCGGNLQVTNTFTRLDTGLRLDTFRTLTINQYLLYQSSFSPKFVAKMKRTQFLMGPTFLIRHWAGLKQGNSETYVNAENQFASFVIGYEFGLGYKIGRVELSARYLRNITNYGQSTGPLPTRINHSRFKFNIHYYFLRKHQGKYWDSINWG